MTAAPFKSFRKGPRWRSHVTRQKRQRDHPECAKYCALFRRDTPCCMGAPDCDVRLGNLRLLENAAAQRPSVPGSDRGGDDTLARRECGTSRTTRDSKGRGTVGG